MTRKEFLNKFESILAHGYDNLDGADIIKEFRQGVDDLINSCAQIAITMWTPSVGGYPSGSEIASAIKKI